MVVVAALHAPRIDFLHLAAGRGNAEQLAFAIDDQPSPIERPVRRFDQSLGPQRHAAVAAVAVDGHDVGDLALLKTGAAGGTEMVWLPSL